MPINDSLGKNTRHHKSSKVPRFGGIIIEPRCEMGLEDIEILKHCGKLDCPSGGTEQCAKCVSKWYTEHGLKNSDLSEFMTNQLHEGEMVCIVLPT